MNKNYTVIYCEARRKPCTTYKVQIPAQDAGAALFKFMNFHDTKEKYFICAIVSGKANKVHCTMPLVPYKGE